MREWTDPNLKQTREKTPKRGNTRVWLICNPKRAVWFWHSQGCNGQRRCPEMNVSTCLWRCESSENTCMRWTSFWLELDPLEESWVQIRVWVMLLKNFWILNFRQSMRKNEYLHMKIKPYAVGIKSYYSPLRKHSISLTLLKRIDTNEFSWDAESSKWWKVLFLKCDQDLLLFQMETTLPVLFYYPTEYNI